MPGGLTANDAFIENTNVKKINHDMINNIIVVERQYVTLDSNGVGTIGWPYNNNHPGGLMLGAYPTTWNPTTTTFTNSGFAEIKCPGLAGQTALFNCVWIQPMWNPVPPEPTP